MNLSETFGEGFMNTPIDRYYGMVESEARKFQQRIEYHPDASIDDVRQVGYLYLTQYYNKLQSDCNEAQSYTYLRTCVRNGIKKFFVRVLNSVYGRSMAENFEKFFQSHYKSSNQQNESSEMSPVEEFYDTNSRDAAIFVEHLSQPSNHYPLDIQAVNKGNEAVSDVHEMISSTATITEAMAVDEDSMVDQIDVDHMLNTLSESERKVLEMPLEGYSREEIAVSIGCDVKQISYYRQKARDKCFYALHHPNITTFS